MQAKLLSRTYELIQQNRPCSLFTNINSRGRRGERKQLSVKIAIFHLHQKIYSRSVVTAGQQQLSLLMLGSLLCKFVRAN